MSPAPTPGRIVLYKLTVGDALEIERHRKDRVGLIGNTAAAGQEYPAVVVRVFGPGEPGTCNLQVLLDGPDSFWATSRLNADSQYVRDRQANGDYKAGGGCWRWPTPVTLVPVPLSPAQVSHVDTQEAAGRSA